MDARYYEHANIPWRTLETAERGGYLLLIWDKVILTKRSGWNCKLGRLFDNNKKAC